VNDAFQATLLAGATRNQQALRRLLPDNSAAGALSGLLEAAHYSLDTGGKRIRPLLVSLSSRAVRGADALPATDHLTCAIELIHTYSLIHDDLPAMDDDDLRRGRPSLHKAYDEATAILVGDGLQARAFELLAEAPGISDARKIAMIRTLAGAAGLHGMVGGQFIDITATGTNMSLEQLQAMHALKTGALIRASLALGGIAAGASAQQLHDLDEYGTHIGLAFQVVDDILDVEGDTQTLGKTQGKDSEANKPTYVKLLGLDGAKAEATRLLGEALRALEGFGESADPLRDLAAYIVARNH
jgi:geranylgeranyl pyrophosphate synthase